MAINSIDVYPYAVSVIVPVYNAEPYLRNCLDSIVNQTLANLQILLINDGSMDNSLAILQEYASKDSRITVFDEPHSGTGAARNIGLKAAQGEYLSFLDADDFFAPNMLELAYLTAKKEYADIVGFKFFDFDNNREVVTGSRGSLDSFNGCDKIVRKKLVEAFNITFQNLMYCNDVFYVLAAHYISAKSVFIEKAIYHYCSGHANATSMRHKYAEDSVEAAKLTRQFLVQNNLYDLKKEDFYRKMLRCIAGELTNCIINNPDKLYFQKTMQSALNFFPNKEDFYGEILTCLAGELINCIINTPDKLYFQESVQSALNFFPNKEDFYRKMLRRIAGELINCIINTPDKLYFQKSVQTALKFFPQKYHPNFFEQMKILYFQFPREKRISHAQEIRFVFEKNHCTQNMVDIKFKNFILYYQHTPFNHVLRIAGGQIFRLITSSTGVKFFLCGIQLVKFRSVCTEQGIKKEIFLFGLPIFSVKSKR